MKVSTKLIIGFSAIVVLFWIIAFFKGNSFRNPFKDTIGKLSRFFHQAFKNLSNSTPSANNLNMEINTKIGI